MINTSTDNLRSNQYEIYDDFLKDDIAVVKSVWKSAHAVEEWPGKVTIRRFSPFKKVKVEGEGKTANEAWKSVADRIRTIWSEEDAKTS
jgi:hypothetical protein